MPLALTRPLGSLAGVGYDAPMVSRADPSQKRISAYALLSNSRVCALVSDRASIDWLCVPEPDSDAVFWSILDPGRGGVWSIEIEGLVSTSRRYVPGTMSLETTLRGRTGTLRVTDALLLDTGNPREQTADHALMRMLACTGGEIDLRVRFAPRPGFGRRSMRMSRRPGLGISVHAGRQSMLLRSDLEMRLGEDGREALAAVRLVDGETRSMALGQTDPGPGVWPLVGRGASSRLLRTNEWWRSWSRALRLTQGEQDGVDADMVELVRRSALTLRSLIYAPTGSVLAAPTTSLPERLGGSRNWDYRFCWIRDASYTMRALLNLGLGVEAEAFLGWLLNASRMTHPRLRVMYDVFGRRAPPERRLDHVRGFEGSRPVRTGNGARGQLQLDTFGAILDAAWQHHEHGGAISASGGRMLRAFVEFASRGWELADHGIWEERARPRHHTLSKAMCWVAMDRGMRLAEKGVMRLDRPRIGREMQRVRERVRTEGYNDRLGSYTATLGGEELDASLLMLSIYGFEEPESQRMRGTIDRVYERLGPGAALYRYRRIDDGIESDLEAGRFGICGFWGVEALAAAKRVDEARSKYDELMGYANDVGLFAEEVDPENGMALGNFPQALTHIGMINASCTLARTRRGERTRSESGAVR